ncbi:MAG: 16S rRNA (cytosine(1402)-N(4))-methyltransferase RsmH [Anaerolineae bacterium]|nr:16S rRNA (cytosine(1402)-N(4))-methyltransferase RsmH [Anaerolineae bacterium]
MQQLEHVPVLQDRVVELLVRGPGGCYVDGTIGAGGHAAAILDAAGPEARLLGLDADPAALAVARRNLAQREDQVTLVHANFRNLLKVARRLGVEAVDGVLLDLGLSSMQLADEERGFSYRLGGRLDMRFDPRTRRTAGELVNRLEEKELARILRRYGEEPLARHIAHLIVESRPVRSASELADIVSRAAPRHRASDSLARTFQALRIAVNEELEALEEGLQQAVELLRPGGRLAVISFHSLEDRIVKQFLRQESATCTCPPDMPVCACGAVPRLRLVNRRPIFPTDDEVEMNPRSRSARLRVAERV